MFTAGRKRMNSKSLIEMISVEIIERLVDEYQSIFSSTKPEECTDVSMRLLVDSWALADENQKKVYAEFLRLGAQNTIASFLGYIDDELVLKTLNDESLSGELLELFWEHQEELGLVNQKT